MASERTMNVAHTRGRVAIWVVCSSKLSEGTLAKPTGDQKKGEGPHRHQTKDPYLIARIHFACSKGYAVMKAADPKFISDLDTRADDEVWDRKSPVTFVLFILLEFSVSVCLLHSKQSYCLLYSK